MKKCYYLTFRTREPCHPVHDAKYGPQATVFTDRAPLDAYKALKAAGLCAAYGREGEKPIRDTHPCEPWDCDAGVNQPSGAKS